MNRAAEAALEVLKVHWPLARAIVVVCGAGNNGGDGYCLARLAHTEGWSVRVLAVAPAEKLRGDALRARQDCAAAGVAIEPWNEAALANADVIVDALFGVGLDRPLDRNAIDIIEAINRAGRPVLALDLPSGLHADTGLTMGACVDADATVSFVTLKAGAYLGEGLARCGTLHFADLGIPPVPESLRQPVLERLEPTLLREVLPRRSRLSHKGDFGHVLVIGGNEGMPGAMRLCGEAALRSGAGLVSVATRATTAAAVVAGRPELMCRAVENAQGLRALLERADVCVIGPGLGRDAWAQDLLAAVTATDRPLVLDADALNLLAAGSGGAPRPQWILTPHPAEAGRLLGRTTQDVQRDRLGALAALVDRFGCTVVLKGAGTLIGAPGRTPAVCDRGNPGMATGGTGDVLAGCIGALTAQLRDQWNAARAGVLAHALAGDQAARDGERGLVASDLLAPLRTWLNPR